MSHSVLYDAPGPRARRRSRIISVVALVVIAALVGVVVWRLYEQDQFEYELWGPLIDPTHEVFGAVWSLLGVGLRNTILAAVLSIATSLVLGTLLGVGRMMLGRWGRMPIVGLLELFRGLPVILSIFFADRVLRDLGVNLNSWPGPQGLWIVVLGLTAYNGVIIAEIIRSGVASLPRGQREAGLAIGMTPSQVMRAVQLPQAFRIMLPALISQLVVIVKDTSLAAILGIYAETLRQARLISLNLDNPIQMFTIAALMFILLNYGLSRLAIWVEKRLSRAERSEAEEVERESEYATGA